MSKRTERYWDWYTALRYSCTGLVSLITYSRKTHITLLALEMQIGVLLAKKIEATAYRLEPRGSRNRNAEARLRPPGFGGEARMGRESFSTVHFLSILPVGAPRVCGVSCDCETDTEVRLRAASGANLCHA